MRGLGLTEGEWLSGDEKPSWRRLHGPLGDMSMSS